MTQKKERSSDGRNHTSSSVAIGQRTGLLCCGEQALAFLNEQGSAFEMWKLMTKADEEFIVSSLIAECIKTAAYD